MDPFLQSVLIQVAGYTLAIIISAWAVNSFGKGVPWYFLRARMAKKKGGVLVKVDSPIGSYFRIGNITGSSVKYKDRNKAQHTLTNGVLGIRDLLGVRYVETDEQTDNVLTVNWQAVPGNDAIKTDALMERIAMLPKKPGSKELLLLILVIATLAVSLYTAYKLGKIPQQTASMVQFAYQNATAGVKLQ